MPRGVGAGIDDDDGGGGVEGGFVSGDGIGRFGFDRVDLFDTGFGFEIGPDEAGVGPDEPGFGPHEAGVGFLDSFVGFDLEKVLDLADFDSDQEAVGEVDFVGRFGLEIAVGVEGGFGLRVAVGSSGFDNVAIGFVERFGGLDLHKHVDEADFVLDDHEIGGVDVHLDVHVGILHLEHVSSPYSSP